jgi:predicted choloylglycine hydrolase
MLYIFADHSHNYAIVILLHNVAMFVRDLNYCTDHVQDRVLKLVEFIVAGLNYTPQEELQALTDILSKNNSPSLTHKVLCQIHKLIKFDARIKDNFRECKLLTVLSDLLATRFKEILTYVIITH